jgi:hypothetical protein
MSNLNEDSEFSYLDVSPSSVAKYPRSRLYKAVRNYFTATMFTANVEKTFGFGDYMWMTAYPSETGLFKNLFELYSNILDGSEPDYSSFRKLIVSQPSFVSRSEVRVNFVAADCDFVASVASRPCHETGLIEILPSVCEDVLERYEPLSNRFNEERIIEKLIDDPPVLTIYAPPHSGKTTFANEYNSEICSSCYQSGTMHRHWNAMFDTDDVNNWVRAPKFVITNIPGVLSVSDYGFAIICSRDEFNNRCRRRGLEPGDTWYDDAMRIACRYPHSFGGFVGDRERLWKRPVPRRIVVGIPEPNTFNLMTSPELIKYLGELEVHRPGIEE